MKKITLAVLTISVGAFLTGFSLYNPAPVTPNYDKMMASVVMIEASDKNGERLGKGSGVILDNGLVASADHVVNSEGAKFKGITNDGRKFDLTVVKLTEKKDIAYLKPSISLVSTAVKMSCKPVTIGQTIISMGNPTWLDFITTFGQVSSVRQHGFPNNEEADFIVASIPLAPGMSGGPVFDTDGNVIGINDAILTAQLGEVMGSDNETTADQSLTGISILVSGEAVCENMPKDLGA
jgi:serine protease Do